MDYRLSSFIKDFINDFQISETSFPDVWIKLKILEFTSDGKTTTEIRRALNLTVTDNNRQKILRIKKNYFHVAQLPQLITLTQLVEIILRRYPLPKCAGITLEIWNDKDTREIWTGTRLCRYIYSYFNIPQFYGGCSLAFYNIRNSYYYDIKKFDRNAKTLQKYLDLKKNIFIKYESTLSQFFKNVFDNYKKYNFYYLMIMKKNHRFFAVLFEMEKEYPEFPIPLTITSIKHKRPESINHLILNQIKHLPYGMSKENIIFVVPSNAYVEAFRSIREGLNLINRNHWILGKGFAYFYSGSVVKT